MDRHHFGGGSPLEICAPLLCSWVHFGGYCVTWNLLRGASGGPEGSLEGRTGVFTVSWNLFGCSQKTHVGFLGASLGALTQNAWD